MDEVTGNGRPGASLNVPGVMNLRDMGGWPTADGRRVRHGVLFRSTELQEAVPAGAGSLAEFGLRTIYDLRTEAERIAQPDVVIESVDQVNLDVLADLSDATPAELPALLSDPEKATRELGHGEAAGMFETAYRGIVSLPSALSSYRRFFGDLAEGSTLPALFHCTTGKDRTGWAAAATLMVLGVPNEMVEREYLLTNADLVPALQPLLDRFKEAGGDPELLMPVLGVREEYLNAAIAEMDEKFGSIEGYFSDGFGLDARSQEAIRRNLLAR